MITEPFWDELGIAWQAVTPPLNAPLDRMAARFRRESRVLGFSLAAGVLFVAIGALGGAFALWQAWRLAAWNFGTRGLAALAVSVILAIMIGVLWPVRGSDNSRSLGDFVELGLARSARGMRAVVLGFLACGVAAVLGVIGSMIRTSAGHPPAIPPIVNLAVLALCAIALGLVHKRLRREQARFEHLQRALKQPGS